MKRKKSFSNEEIVIILLLGMLAIETVDLYMSYKAAQRVT